MSISTGIGLRAPHVAEVLATRPAAGFLEVHNENYFGGGSRLKQLESLRETYPLSLHGVGLSLGRADGLDAGHLRQVADLVRRFEPFHVSEHLSWSAFGHDAAPDLLPLPFTHEALEIAAQHVDQVQTAIGRQILIENPSNYLAFDGMDFDEPEFLSRLAVMTGCGLLLDINNIHVSAHNLGRDATDYLDRLSGGKSVRQYHLAGHEISGDFLIDTHGARVCEDVWTLYAEALARFGDHPTLIEWDSDIPALVVLLEEAHLADRHRAAVHGFSHAL